MDFKDLVPSEISVSMMTGPVLREVSSRPQLSL